MLTHDISKVTLEVSGKPEKKKSMFLEFLQHQKVILLITNTEQEKKSSGDTIHILKRKVKLSCALDPGRLCKTVCLVQMLCSN